MSAPDAARALCKTRGQAVCLPRLFLRPDRRVRYTRPPCSNMPSLQENGARAPSRGASPRCCARRRARAAVPVCKYIDPAGNIVFSNLPPREGISARFPCLGAEEPRKTSSRRAKSTPTPAGFPKVDAETQRTRDDMRRKVLTDELSAEEKLLAEARKLYANGAPAPLPEEQSNAAKYQERIARLRQSVQLHERNIEALKKELGNTTVGRLQPRERSREQPAPSARNLLSASHECRVRSVRARGPAS